MVDACSTVSTGSREGINTVTLCRQQAFVASSSNWMSLDLSLLFYITEKYSYEVVGPVRYSAPPIPVSRRVGTRHSAAGGGRGE